VTITGTNLTGATGVTIGGTAAPITAITATEITATTPAGTAGTASVLVTTPGGTNAANTLFTYQTPPSLTWSNATSMNTARSYAAAVVLNDGKVLVTGGLDASNNVLSTAERYDPVAGTWTTISMVAGRWLHRAEKLADGRVLVIAGANQSRTALNSAEIYDPATGNFTAVASLAESREEHASAVLSDGKVLVHGGWVGSSIRSSGEVYDPATNTWTATTGTNVTRVEHELVRLTNGKVLMIGGHDGSYQTICYLYDPATNAWTATGSLTNVRPYSKNVVLSDGKVLATGHSVTCELYDPAAGTWSITGSMSTARSQHNLILLGDGRVLAIGGGNASSEIYNPATATWSAAAALNNSRSVSVAVRLLNGDPLVAGGHNGSATTNTVETFDAPAVILPPAPTVASISPATGSTAGGTVVTITGTDLTGATAVTIGGTAATLGTNTGTTLTVTTGARAAGAGLSVLVTTPGGTNAANTLFTYAVPTNVALSKPVIRVSSEYSSGFSASKVTDGSTTDSFGNNYWITLDNQGVGAFFTLDLQGIFYLTEIRLRNTNNTGFNDRGTGGFRILASNSVNGSNQLISPQTILTGTLTQGSGTLVSFTTSNGFAAGNYRYLHFVVDSLAPWASTGSAGLNEIEAFGVTGVAPPNAAPTDITLTPASIAENNAANATVGALTATDADAGQTHTFSKVTGDGDADNGSFTIDGTALKLTPVANFEVKSSYSVRVQADDGNGGTFARAITISVTNVNEVPSFTKGANQLLPYNTSSAQTASGWATAINDGDSTVTQGLTFNISSNSNPGLFTTGPSINSSTGTLTYTPNGTVGTTTIGVTLTDDNSINSNAALTTLEQTFTITVQPVPDYTVATTGNVIVVTDLSGNGDTLAVTEPSVGNIQFAAGTRTFSVNGGLQIVGNSGAVTLTSVTSITVNAAAGADTINVGAFTGTLPSLTLNGGIGDDTVNLNGDITFVANANLDVDLQNDDVTPGVDLVNVATGANLLTSGTGTISVKTSKNVAMASGSSFETVNGGITVEANMQTVLLNGNFHGIDLNNAIVSTSGTGSVSMSGKGGNTASTSLDGIFIQANGKVQSLGASAGAGTITLNGTGGRGSNASFCFGVQIDGAGSAVSSVNGGIQITGQGGLVSGVTQGSNGVHISSGGVVSSSGTAAITVNATGGTGQQQVHGMRLAGTDSTITSVNGAIQITAIGGTATGAGSRGLLMDAGTVISSTGTGGSAATIGITGTGGVGGNNRVGASLAGTVQTVDGNIVITGAGGAAGSGTGSQGVLVSGGGVVRSAGVATITLNGTEGGSTTNQGLNVSGVGSQVQATGTGSITFVANNILIDTANAIIDGGTNPVSIRQRTNGTLIALGGVDVSTSTLGLTDAELDRITAGTLNIGDANSGAITVSAAITRSAATVLNLTSGANIDLSTGSLNSAGSNVTLNPGTNVFASNSGVDVTTGVASTLTLPSTDSLKIVIDGKTADTEHTQLNVAGLIDLTGAVLSLSGSYTLLPNDILTIVNNDGTDAITGTFGGLTEGAVVTFNGIPLTVSYVGGSGNDVTLSYLNEIAVTGNSVDISSGDVTPTTLDHTDFGIQLASTGSKSRIFTITNSGMADLTIGTISFSGTGMADFSVVSTPSSPLAPAGVTTFEVVFDPAAVGLSTATLSIVTNDLDENPFTFAIQGTGSDGTPAVAAAEFSQPGTGGTQISGAAAGTTLYQFGGAPALNTSGAAAYSGVIRYPDGTLHHAMLAGSPATILVQDTTDMSAMPSFSGTLPANTKFLNFRSPLINSSGRVAFVADLSGTGFNSGNRRGVFTNVADGTMRMLMRQGGPDPATGSTFSAVGVVALAGDGVIFTANTVDGRTGLYGYDPVEGVDLLFRTGSVIGSGGSNKTVSAFSILATTGYTPGQGQEHVADALNPGDRLTTLACTFTDGSTGVIKARFNSTAGSYSGFDETYAEKGRLIDFAAGADAVLPLGKFENGFNKPGWDQTGTYYGFMGYLMRGIAGVNDYTDAALFVDLDPEQLVMQVREGSAVTGIAGATYKDFYSLMVGGGDYEFAFLADMRGTGITAANDLGFFAKHSTLGVVQVAREGGAAAGVTGGLFQNLNQMALPGDGQPILNATLALGSGGVTTSNDNGLWVMNGLGELRLAVREGDVFTLGGSPRTVSTIQSLSPGSSAAVGARIFTADGTMKIQVGFTDGTQGFIEVLVP